MANDDRDAPISSEYALPAGRAELIDTIYRIALEPQSHDVFTDHWNDHANRASAELTHLRDRAGSVDSDLDGHFRSAFGILEELRRQPSTHLHMGVGPRILLDTDGRIAWSNAAAQHMFDLSPEADVKTMEPSLGDATPLRKLLAGLARDTQDSEADSCILPFDTVRGKGYMLARAIEERNGEPFVLIEPLPGEWPPALNRLLAGAFNLNAAETLVATGIAQGLTATAIAAQRGISISTLLTEIHTVFAKTGASNQADLVRLVTSAARACDRFAREFDEPTAPVVCVTAKGREVPIVLRGPQGGSPVIFFHGMLDGCSATSRIELALEEAGLRLIAPIRPGFGTAAPNDCPPQSASARFAEDVEQVLDRLRLDQVVLLGHMGGALHAFAAAARLKDRVLGIVNVAGAVPIVSMSQFAGMSRRQRLLGYMARFVPEALPFVLRAGIRKLDFDGARSFMTALYERSPRDLATILDAEVYQALSRGYRFTVAQGHRALETEGYQVVRDWSEITERSDTPVTLLHGRHDPVVSADSVGAFARRLGDRARVRMFDTCGQLVFYTAPEAVCQVLRAHVNSSGHENDRAAGVSG